MRNIVRFIIIIFLLTASIITWQVSRFYMYLKRTDYSIKPFERQGSPDSLRVLFLGDSTAVGTGAKTNLESVAGWFARQYPKATIVNNSRNGRKIGDLLQEFDFTTAGSYDLLIIQIGGNDILRFTRIETIRTNLSLLLDRAKRIAKHVVVLHSGNVGIAPLFIWPFSDLLTEQTIRVRDVYQHLAVSKGVIYVDLFHQRDEDPLNKNIDLNYSLDYLHPSGQGYRSWFERMNATLNKVGIL